MKVMAGRGGRRGREVGGMSGTSNRLRRVQLQIEKELRKRICQWSKQKLKLSQIPPPPPSLAGHRATRVQRAESSQPLQMSGRALMAEQRIYTR